MASYLLNDLSRYSLSEKDARRAFGKLKRTPEFFRRYLQRYLTYANLGAQAALDYTAARVFDNSSYRASWGRLKAADRAVLRALAQGLIDLHSLPALGQLGNALGLGRAVTLDTPRHALNRLQKEELVVKIAHGHYRIQDQGFAEWLRERDLEE